jgi:hypothetical protein
VFCNVFRGKCELEKVHGCGCVAVRGVELLYVIFEGGKVSGVFVASIVWSWYKL